MESTDPVEAPKPSVARRVLRFVARNPLKTIALIVVLILGVEFATLPFGEIERLKKENPKETAFMVAAAELAGNNGKQFRKKQSWVPLGSIPKDAINAVIVAEDGTFWSHSGFDWFEFQESLKRNIKEGRFARGASTITQQLVKNLYLSSSKDPLRKIKEWALTWKMERTISKSRILEIYLNVIEWGEGIYGIEAAAQQYFGKSASDLTSEESARLAAVIPNPKRYRANSDSRTVVRRTGIILNRMNARGFLSSDDEIDSLALEDLSEESETGENTTLPPLPIVQENVCPFENGCEFTYWVVKQNIAIYAQEGDLTNIAFTAAPNDTLVPGKMNMHIERAGMVVVTKAIEGFSVQDTLYILTYRGEGFYDVWHKGKIVEVEKFWYEEEAPEYRALLLVQPHMSWWVHVSKSTGQEGWLRLVNTATSGIDFDEEIEFHGGQWDGG